MQPGSVATQSRPITGMIAKAYIFTKVCLLLNNIKLCSVIIISHFFLFSNKKEQALRLLLVLFEIAHDDNQYYTAQNGKDGAG